MYPPNCVTSHVRSGNLVWRSASTYRGAAGAFVSLSWAAASVAAAMRDKARCELIPHSSGTGPAQTSPTSGSRIRGAALFMVPPSIALSGYLVSSSVLGCDRSSDGSVLRFQMWVGLGGQRGRLASD